MHLPANFLRYDASFVAAILVAAGMLFFLRRARNNFLALPEIIPVKDAKLPDCMVVIPARNEEKTIARAIGSLPADSVIVADDWSTDRTAAVAQHAGAGVLPAAKLAFGAWGKPNACAEGARVLTSKWILFADADTWFEPAFLASVVAAAETEKVDFVSVHLKPEYHGFTMKALGPVGTALVYSGFARNADRAELFNGQCILVRRHPYEFIGGHRAVARFMDDDLKLAALAQRHRMRYAVARAPQLSHADIRAADFIRAAYRYEGPRLWTGMRIVTAGLFCALWLPVLVWLIVNGDYPVAVVFAFLPTVLLRVWYGWRWAWLAPVGIYLALPVLLGAAWVALTGRRLRWKGREY